MATLLGPAALCARRLSTHAASSGAAAAEVYDVAIVGGGMVGAALACRLNAHPLTAALRVVVLDRGAAPDLSSPSATAAAAAVPDLRVSTVTPASIRLLRDAGAWEDIEPRSARFQHMQVWDQGGHGYVRYSAGMLGLQHMGYVAENRVIQAALAHRLKRPGNLTASLLPAALDALSLPSYTAEPGSAGAELAELTLADGRRLRARLVVGADGGRSRVRQLADLRAVSWSYNQRGIVATVRTEAPNTTAWQRFLPTGPLALLPVRDGFSNIVWSTTAQQAKQLEAASPEAFADAVNQALQSGPSPQRSRLLPPSRSAELFEVPPRVLPVPEAPAPQSFPLALAGAGRYVRPRLALVGDAAHVVHPLAGQGVNLGFGDAAALADALVQAVESGRDPGEMALLEELYEAPRLRANAVMAAALDGLKRVFQPQQGALAQLRGLGLDIINSTPVLQRGIMKYAMGL